MALLRFCQTMLRRQRQETAGTLLERKRLPIELLANGPRLRALDNQIFSRETSRNLEKPRESSRILENPREISPRVLRVGRQAAVAHHLALFLVFFFASITRTYTKAIPRFNVSDALLTLNRGIAFARREKETEAHSFRTIQSSYANWKSWFWKMRSRVSSASAMGNCIGRKLHRYPHISSFSKLSRTVVR